MPRDRVTQFFAKKKSPRLNRRLVYGPDEESINACRGKNFTKAYRGGVYTPEEIFIPQAVTPERKEYFVGGGKF